MTTTALLPDPTEPLDHATAEAAFGAILDGQVGEDETARFLVTMAERDGVDPALLRALLAGDEARMTGDAALGWRHARAVLVHDVAAAPLREEILRRWGPRALVSVAFAIAAGRLFPTVKYGLGHGIACSRVTVGGDAVPVARRAA